ncbi:MarR family winged helix-turn-helix transcriptional regulator, partial [Amycolatopsis sp. NPDC059019]|uniref:MarR family winged helix-turn-helix transcriptional regulator n=1 Tax=Amycolatopsis sp. NPDC059019 TaxID=3346702 RepID=UPI00366D5C1B
MTGERTVRDRVDVLNGLSRELKLLSRHQVLPHSLATPLALERSAFLLLSRLEADQPMSLRELAEAFGLDVSTVNRQVAALLRQGLAERIPDPGGGLARKLRATEEGKRKLGQDQAQHRAGLDMIMTHWSAADRHTFFELLRRFNEDIEALQGTTPWPRGEKRGWWGGGGGGRLCPGAAHHTHPHPPTNT